MSIREVDAGAYKVSKPTRLKAVAVARTIARLGGYASLQVCAVAEAIQYKHRHLGRWVDDFEEAST